MSYEAKIILDSLGPNGARLTTFELSYPRMVHADFMTHRVFSRNAASSRAVPVEKRLAAIEADPVLPVWWGKNQSGMQAREELQGPELQASKDVWLQARDAMLTAARTLGRIGLHKQLANRIVEPWMFITVVVTATEWSNFFALRDHGDAQPELADVAGKAHALYKASIPMSLAAGEDHLPYVTGYDRSLLDAGEEELAHISIGRCAAVSYMNQDKRDAPADVARTAKLRGAGHMSPFEHVATALTELGWEDEAWHMAEQWIKHRIPPGNLWGWRQYRKTIDREHDFSLINKETA